MVMHRPAKPRTPVRFRSQPKFCPGGGIGRRKGLKIPRWKHRAGSIPAPGTIYTLRTLEFSYIINSVELV